MADPATPTAPAQEAAPEAPAQSVLEQNPDEVDVKNLTPEQEDSIIKAAFSDQAPAAPAQEPPAPPAEETPSAPQETPTQEPTPAPKEGEETPQQPQETLVQKHARLSQTVGKQGNELGHLRQENERLKTQLGTPPQQVAPQQPAPQTPKQETDFDPFDQNQIAQLVTKQAEKLHKDQQAKDKVYNDFVHELTGFQNNHPEYKTQASLQEIDRIGQSHAEYAKMQEVLDLVEYGNQNGIQNTEASFLFMQKQTGYMEQRLASAKKEGTKEAVEKITNAAEATRTIGGMGQGDKTVPKTLIQAKTDEEATSLLNSATPKQLIAFEKELMAKMNAT